MWTLRCSRNGQHSKAGVHNRQRSVQGASIREEVLALSTFQALADCAVRLVDNCCCDQAQ